MRVEQTKLSDCLIIIPRIFNDERGFFYESYNEKSFLERTGINTHFVQDNTSCSTKGVLRGLHFQKGEHAQAKLVRVTKGEVWDIAVDLRIDSPTYGKYIGILLSEENHKQLFIPRGFAHGFVVLSETAIFQYKCDNYYNKKSEGGIHYADETLAIDWKLPHKDLLVSEKDLELEKFHHGCIVM